MIFDLVVNCFQMRTNCKKIWWIGKVVVMLQADEEGKAT